MENASVGRRPSPHLYTTHPLHPLRQILPARFGLNHDRVQIAVTEQRGQSAQVVRVGFQVVRSKSVTPDVGAEMVQLGTVGIFLQDAQAGTAVRQGPCGDDLSHPSDL